MNGSENSSIVSRNITKQQNKTEKEAAITWPAAVTGKPEMQPCLSATHSVAVPGRAGEERRKGLECEEREELNCPTSEMDW